MHDEAERLAFNAPEGTCYILLAIERGAGQPVGMTLAGRGVQGDSVIGADIFEAISAMDRPHKKGKPLSEAIKIMAFMKKDQHLDADLFELFLRSGAYLDYARRFMPSDQMDEVDVNQFLTPVAA